MPSLQSIGNFWGEKILTTGFETLIDGITTAAFVVVKPLSTNRGDIILRDKTDSGPGVGLRLEPTEPPTKIYIGYDNSRLRARATANGNTITYMGTDQ